MIDELCSEEREARSGNVARSPLPAARSVFLWQAVAAALFIVLLFSASFSYFSSRLTEWQYLGVLKGDLVSSIQQLAREVQSVNQRLTALEKARQGSPAE